MKGKKFGPGNNIVLIIAQSKDLDQKYFEQIQQVAEKAGVKLCFVGDKVVSDSSYNHQEGVYPFYSIYTLMDLIIYSPTHEGFGNQAVEAAWAKKLLIMHGYPVAEADIFPYVKGIIRLGNSADVLKTDGMLKLEEGVVQEAVQKTVAALIDHDLERDLTMQAYQGFRNLCNINEVTSRYIQIYRKLQEKISRTMLAR